MRNTCPGKERKEMDGGLMRVATERNGSNARLSSENKQTRVRCSLLMCGKMGEGGKEDRWLWIRGEEDGKQLCFAAAAMTILLKRRKRKQTTVHEYSGHETDGMTND